MTDSRHRGKECFQAEAPGARAGRWAVGRHGLGCQRNPRLAQRSASRLQATNHLHLTQAAARRRVGKLPHSSRLQGP